MGCLVYVECMGRLEGKRLLYTSGHGDEIGEWVVWCMWNVWGDVKERDCFIHLVTVMKLENGLCGVCGMYGET